MKEEARLLLAKIHFAMGDYLRCLSVFEEMALDNISVSGVSNRKLQLMAEAYAIKGTISIISITSIHDLSPYSTGLFIYFMYFFPRPLTGEDTSTVQQ